MRSFSQQHVEGTQASLLVTRAFRRLRQPCEVLDLIQQLSRALFQFKRHRLAGSGGADALAGLHELMKEVLAERARNASLPLSAPLRRRAIVTGRWRARVLPQLLCGNIVTQLSPFRHIKTSKRHF